VSDSKGGVDASALLTRASQDMAVGDYSGARTAALVAIAAALVQIIEEES
jgi:hypothetical protein